MSRRFLTFELSHQLYGIDVLWAREILRQVPITLVDRADPWVRGLVNLRGQLLTVIDLSRRLGGPTAPPTQGSDCVVLRTHAELDRLPQRPADFIQAPHDPTGLLVDAVGDVLELEESPNQAANTHPAARASRYIAGVFPLKNRLLIELRPGPLLSLDLVELPTPALAKS